MAPTVSVVTVLCDSISWEEYAMTICKGKRKNAQEGANELARLFFARILS